MHTILVVEDQKLTRTMLCDTLQEHGYQTVEAEDGMEGLNMVENENISLVISDLVMPNFDGTDFLNLLSSCHPEIKKISMTSIPEDHRIYQEAAKIIGKENIIQKSDSFDDVIAMVKTLLD